MVELPDEKWPELMPALLQFAQDQDNVQLRVSTLVTLGFICETIVGTLVAFKEKRAHGRTPKSSQLDRTRSSLLSSLEPGRKRRV
jgi:hypothetical protein